MAPSRIVERSRSPSRSDDGAIDRQDWYDVGGGEAGYIAPFPPDPNIVYAADYQGNITRYDRRIGQVKSITEQPELSDAWGAANLEHSFPMDCAGDDLTARSEHALSRQRAVCSKPAMAACIGRRSVRT